ncbi:MAG TPA: hypothetical protein VJ123_09280 [Anaerolineales bacterium]|nr:hypothetical protein [Anaerolineales bacterium]
MMVDYLLSSRFGPPLGLAFARLLPRRLAYSLVDRSAARMAARPNSALVRALTVNQAVVRGLDERDPRLGEAVRQVLKHAGRGYADLFGGMARGRRALEALCSVDGPFWDHVLRTYAEGHGVIVVAGHLAGFDPFILWLGNKRLPIQGLSYPDPRGSYKTQLAMRKRYGLNLTPVSMEALRQAIRHLRSGGIVMTAVDRPGLGGAPLRFFGRSAVLPVGHARLSLRTGAPMFVCACHSDGRGHYYATGAKLDPPASSGDEKVDAIHLAQRALDVLEGYIRLWPEQWLMFQPVWPERTLASEA